MYPITITQSGVSINLNNDSYAKSIQSIFKFLHKKFYYHKTEEELDEEIEQIKVLFFGIPNDKINEIVLGAVTEFLKYRSKDMYFNLSFLDKYIKSHNGDGAMLYETRQRANLSYKRDYTDEEYKKLVSTVGDIEVY